MLPIPTVSRRGIIRDIAAAALALTAAEPATAQQRFPEKELTAQGALPDIVQGKAGAPVTLIEYASLTCPHCAHFHQTVYPILVKTYVDTGKVRFIQREYPRDPLDIAAFMLARCEGADKRDATLDLLFAQQDNWAFTDKPLEALQNVLRLTGMDKERFDACLKDQRLYDQVREVHDRAARAFGVDVTPTFFVNGTKIEGGFTPDSLAKTLDPLVDKKS